VLHNRPREPVEVDVEETSLDQVPEPADPAFSLVRDAHALINRPGPESL
jgi:hypothetical protein